MVTIRNNSLELEDGDTISVDGTELTFRSSGELEFPDGETAISLSDIDGADIAPNSVTATTEVTSPSVTADALEAGGADTRFDFVSDVIGGTVAAGDAGPVWITTLTNGETLNVTQAALTLDGGGAAPTGLDLIIGDLTNMTSESTLIDGDGTVKDDRTGTPLGSYTNNSGAAEQVAVLIDNGQFNAGTGSNQDAIGSFIGRVA